LLIPCTVFIPVSTRSNSIKIRPINGVLPSRLFMYCIVDIIAINIIFRFARNVVFLEFRERTLDLYLSIEHVVYDILEPSKIEGVGGHIIRRSKGVISPK